LIRKNPYQQSIADKELLINRNPYQSVRRDTGNTQRYRRKRETGCVFKKNTKVKDLDEKGRDHMVTEI
jgi:hypothetical protein